MTTNSQILFDARWVGTHGIGRFASELSNRLPCLKPIRLSGKPTDLRDCFKLSWRLWQSDDTFFSPGFNAPLCLSLFCKNRFVFVIHDLIHINYPAEGSRAKRCYYDYVVRPAAQKAFRVLTVSEYSKSEIVSWAGVAPEQVDVVGAGVGPEFSPVGPSRDTDHDYILYVGNQKPHKNLEALLRAMPSIQRVSDVRLAVTGTPSNSTLDQVQELGLDDKVEFLGKLSDSELAMAYRGAKATVLPSVYEGFGLPVIESMASGTPVVCSNVTSLPEVAGDAAVLVNPNAQDLADGVARVLSDVKLANDLSIRGLQRASQFTWESTASKVQMVLEKLATANMSPKIAAYLTNQATVEQ